MISLEKLSLTLFDIGAVKLGNFTLHSGKKSPIYMDLRVLVSFPQVLREVAQAYQTILEELHFDLLAAYPYAALPIGTAIALEMNVPLIYPRKEAKSYGTGKSIEGVWELGQRAVVIEDLVTSGKSIAQAVPTLKAAGLRVTEAVVLIDREQGGREMLAEHGYGLNAVITISMLLNHLEDAERISAKQKAKVLKMLDIQS
jgi:uridine monophosphate synthetase